MAKIKGDGIVLDKTGTRFFLDGRTVTEKVYRKRYPETNDDGQLSTGKPWSRPLKMVSMAVDPTQIKEAAELDRKLGVPTDYTADGRPIITDRDHRARFLRAHGKFDRDAGYGDAAPIHHKGEKAPPSRIRELAHEMAHRIRRRHEGAR